MVKKITLMFIVALVNLAGFVSAHTGNDSYDHHMMGGAVAGSYGWWLMLIFGWIFMILILVAMVLFIIWLIKQIQAPQKRRRK